MPDKNDLINTLSDWNFWDREQKTGLPRPLYLPKILDSIARGQITTIVGVRRCGKSYLMRQAAAQLISQGVSKTNILFANFEDPRFGEKSSLLLENILQAFKQTFSPQGDIYLFLDEIQEISEWEKWVRTVHELGQAKIIISGSNGKLLFSELATLLTGRHSDVMVYPLSFREFLDFKMEKSPGELFTYLEIGGFPDIVLDKGDKALLLSYFEDIISEDLVKRFKIRKNEGLNASYCLPFNGLFAIPQAQA